MVNSRDPKQKTRCPHIKRDGEQCKNWAIIGGPVCRKHGGQLPNVKKAAAARVARAKVEAELTRMGEHLDGTDPTGALLGLVCEAAGNVGFLRRKVQMLQQDWGHGDAIAGPNHLEDGAPHIFVTMYGEWCDKLARYSKMAIEAGIVERQVRLAEQQGELVAQVIRGVLADLNIAASPEVLTIVGRHLALVVDAA